MDVVPLASIAWAIARAIAWASAWRVPLGRCCRYACLGNTELTTFLYPDPFLAWSFPLAIVALRLYCVWFP